MSATVESWDDLWGGETKPAKEPTIWDSAIEAVEGLQPAAPAERHWSDLGPPQDNRPYMGVPAFDAANLFGE